MIIIRSLLALGGLLGGVLGVAIAVAATIALGPLFFIPYLLIYVWLRLSGLTPKQIRKMIRQERAVVSVMEYTVPDDIWAPLPAPIRTDHAPWLLDLPVLPNPDRITYVRSPSTGKLTRSIFDNGKAPVGPSSLD